MRRQVNNWFVVLKDDNGVHIYHWDQCPARAMKEGIHLCGLGHMTQTVSNLMTPDTTVANRESTLELKPPLNREGNTPVEAKGNLETTPAEPEKAEQLG